MANTQTPTPTVLTWSAPSAHDHDRSPRWYLFGGIAVLACAVYGILTGALSFALVSLLIGGLYFLVRTHEMPKRTIALSETGVTFENTFTPFSDLCEFWILETPLATELHITRRRGLDREIVIHLEGVGVNSVREFLSSFLPENLNRRERLVDKFIRYSKL